MSINRITVLLVVAAALLTGGCKSEFGQKTKAFEVPSELDDGAVIVHLDRQQTV